MFFCPWVCFYQPHFVRKSPISIAKALAFACEKTTKFWSFPALSTLLAREVQSLLLALATSLRNWCKKNVVNQTNLLHTAHFFPSIFSRANIQIFAQLLKNISVLYFSCLMTTLGPQNCHKNCMKMPKITQSLTLIFKITITSKTA